MIKIDHGYGVITWYGHLLKSAIRQGSMVKRGELIGYVGNTGRSTGSHLHYTVLLNGVPVNPRKYLN
jgi:murein DD-endopeptidase MepM/ murein hydrolase activator NlpD